MSYPCMLAHKFDVARIQTWPVAVEPKLDGVRCLFIIDKFSVEVRSRAGKPFTSVEHIGDALHRRYDAAKLKGTWVIDGELFCGDFKTTVSQIRKKNVQAEDATFTAFDMYPIEVHMGDATSVPWHNRRQRLIGFIASGDFNDSRLIDFSTVRLCHDEAAIMSAYEDFRAAGHEGAIVKTTDSLWSPRRSYAYMKLKASDTEDLPVIGAVEGEGKYVGTLGKLIVRRCAHIDTNANGAHFVEVGVGTGMDDSERDYLWRMWNLGVLTGRVAEVGYHEVTPDGSLRHPVYHGLRIDK